MVMNSQSYSHNRVKGIAKCLWRLVAVIALINVFAICLVFGADVVYANSNALRLSRVVVISD